MNTKIKKKDNVGSTSTPKQLADEVLQQIEYKYGSLEFPIDPYKLLKEKDILIMFSDFEKIEGIILKDGDNKTIVGVSSTIILYKMPIFLCLITQIYLFCLDCDTIYMRWLT